MSPRRGSDTQISWLHWIAVTATFHHVKTTILTQSYSNSGLVTPPAQPLAAQLAAWAHAHAFDADPAVALHAILIWSRLHR